VSSAEDNRESGSALMVVGWVMILFAFLVMFFHPAGLKLGQTRFAILAACLAIAGVALSLLGVMVRRRNN
jgi:NADH:ubiquinone oxidoreductase subunit 6 (subunit J)